MATIFAKPTGEIVRVLTKEEEKDSRINTPPSGTTLQLEFDEDQNPTVLPSYSDAPESFTLGVVGGAVALKRNGTQVTLVSDGARRTRRKAGKSVKAKILSGQQLTNQEIQAALAYLLENS